MYRTSPCQTRVAYSGNAWLRYNILAANKHPSSGVAKGVHVGSESSALSAPNPKSCLIVNFKAGLLLLVDADFQLVIFKFMICG